MAPGAAVIHHQMQRHIAGQLLVQPAQEYYTPDPMYG